MDSLPDEREEGLTLEKSASQLATAVNVPFINAMLISS